MNQEVLGKSLQKLRKNFGCTQQQISNALNIHRSTYAYYENGKTIPNIFMLISLSEIFQLPLDKLLSYLLSQTDQMEGINYNPIFCLSKQEVQLILSYRAMSETQQQKLLQLLSFPFSKDLF